MHFYRWLLLFPILGFCACFSTGCASQRPMVSTWLNTTIAPAHTNTIAVKSNANARPVDVETAKLLANELQQEGFVLAPIDQADYFINCVVSDNVEQHVISDNSASQPAPPPAPAASPEAGQPGMVYSYSTVEKSYYIRTRDIRLLLFTNPRTNPAGLQLAWQGSITIGKEKSAPGIQRLLKTLLQHYGSEFHGRVKEN